MQNNLLILLHAHLNWSPRSSYISLVISACVLFTKRKPEAHGSCSPFCLYGRACHQACLANITLVTTYQ